MPERVLESTTEQDLKKAGRQIEEIFANLEPLTQRLRKEAENAPVIKTYQTYLKGVIPKTGWSRHKYELRKLLPIQ